MADRIFELESGRGLSFSSAGDSLARRIVFLCLPMGLAGAFDPDPIVTDRWGVRLIVIDRPGYASSAPLDGAVSPTAEGRADDIAEYVARSERATEEVTKADFGEFGVIGWGAGAATALALAARHPEIVDRVAVVAAPAPRKSKLRQKLDASLDTYPVPRGATVESLAEELGDHPWNRIEALGIGDADPALSSVVGLQTRLDRSIAEAATQGALGAATDLISAADHGWAAQLSKIDASIAVFTGDLDPVTDESDAAWFGSHVPGSTVVTVEGAGHLVVASAWEQILGHVAPQHGGLPAAARE